MHELVHVAQQRARPARPGSRRGSRPPARWLDPEAEARDIATAWRSRGEVWEPVAELRAGALAAERGDVGTVPKPPATETTPVFAVPAGLSEQQADEVGVGLRQAAIGRVVQRRFAQERERIVAHLNGLWVDGGDVRNCLQILDTFPFLVARALVDSLPTSNKTDLTAGLETSHHRAYPAAAVAALSALAPIQLAHHQGGQRRGPRHPWVRRRRPAGGVERAPRAAAERAARADAAAIAASSSSP